VPPEPAGKEKGGGGLISVLEGRQGHEFWEKTFKWDKEYKLKSEKGSAVRERFRNTDRGQRGKVGQGGPV